MSRENKPLLVCIATLTRRRPKMLEALIRSWSSLKIPDKVSPVFVVIENDDEEKSKSVIQNLEPLFNKGRLTYALEKEPGIPFARNRAAQEAINISADLLLFVDDDEEVDIKWLENIIAGYRNSDAKLIGAPLRAKKPKKKLNMIQNLMFKNINNRYQKKEKRASSKTAQGGTPGVTIVTNNWLAETTLFSKHNIWFDESMRHTGGTDSKFYAEVIEKNIPTAWVTDAYVYETISEDRLSFVYQYERARDQSNTNFRRKNKGNVRLNLMVLASILMKSFAVAILIITLPISLGLTLMTTARSLGWIAGRIGAIMGSESSLYSKTTGN